VNIDAPLPLCAALCRHVCYARLALKCAALREALAFMGHAGREGEGLAAALASHDLAPLLSRREVEELLQCERAAAVLHMRNRQQQQQDQQQQQEEQQQRDARGSGPLAGSEQP
jgi:hypothetical protein